MRFTREQQQELEQAQAQVQAQQQAQAQAQQQQQAQAHGRFPVESGLPAEGLLQYGPRSDAVSQVLSGNIVDLCSASITTPPPTPELAKAAERIPALPGRLVPLPPAPALPMEAGRRTLAALVVLAPGALAHEWIFQRALYVALWGGGAGGGVSGSYPPTPLPPGLTPAALGAAVAWAQGITLFSLVLWVAGMSLHFLGRAATPWHRPSLLATRHWLCAVACALALQVLHSCAVAGGGGGAGGSPFLPAGAPWDVWVAVLLWQVAAHVLLTGAKAMDVARHTQTMKRLRLSFDTRLGQWSPR